MSWFHRRENLRIFLRAQRCALARGFLGVSRNEWRHAETRFGVLRKQTRSEFGALAAAVFQTALRQRRNSRGEDRRSVDRLHQAAMEELKASPLMPHEEGQAKAALEAGFKVVLQQGLEAPCCKAANASTG